ncbi:MAG: TIGR03067 domain-containing protein [Gemmataceae bacterium]
MIAPLLTLAALLVPVDAADDAKKTQEQLQGTWRIKEMVLSGRTTPAEKLEKAVMVFKDDTMTLTDGDRKRAFRFKLDPSKKPAEIEVTAIGGTFNDQKATGIYELKDGSLKLCLPNKPGLGAIKEFSAPEGSQQAYFVLEKMK